MIDMDHNQIADGFVSDLIADELDEVGWVFVAFGQPWLVRIWGNRPWLFRWHPDKAWVSHTIVTQEQIWQFPHNLTKKQQEIYHRIHRQKLGAIGCAGS